MTAARRLTAARMIGLGGQVVTISGASSGTYSPATGAVTSVAYSATASAVLSPMSAYRKANSSMVVEGDEQMLLSALDASGSTYTAPPVNSVVTLSDGSKRTIVAVETLAPAGLAILHDCIVRGNA